MSGPLETGAFPEEGAGAGAGPGPGPSQALAGADGKDLVKRARAVKGRFLFAFGGLLQAFAPGRFGALAGLDSPRPVLYVEFPQGRLKLFGALVSPKATNYALLNVEDHRNRKDQVLIEEVFESLVVFSEAWWVGTPEENPDEEQLPVPDAVRRGGGTGADEAGPSGADVYECGAVDCSLPPLASNVKRKAGVTFEPGVGQGAAGGGDEEAVGGADAKKPKAELEGPRELGGAAAQGPAETPDVVPIPTEDSPRAGAPKASPTEDPAPAPVEAPKPNVITLDWDSD